MYFARIMKSTVCFAAGFWKAEFVLQVDEPLKCLSCPEGSLCERSIFKAALKGKLKLKVRLWVKNRLFNCEYKYLKHETKHDSDELGRHTNVWSSQQFLQGWLPNVLERKKKYNLNEVDRSMMKADEK